MNIIKLEWKLLMGKLLGRKRNTSYVVMQKGDKFLLVQERTSHIKGLWGFPGGGVKKGETEEEAAVREAKEEAGYDVRLQEKIASYEDKKRASIRNVFLAKIIDGSGEYEEDEIMNTGWFTKEEILNMKDTLRGDWVLKAIEDL